MTLKRLSPLITIIMLPLAGYLGWRAFRDHTLAEIAASVFRIAGADLTLAFLFAACSYACLTGFDTLAIRYLGRDLSYPKIALTSFVALSIGHNVGVAALSSGTLRYRFYSAWGFSAAEVAKIILFCGVTVGLGLVTLAGLACLGKPGVVGDLTGVSQPLAIAAGLACLGLSAGYVLLAWRWRGVLRIRSFELPMPPLRIAAAQVAMGTINFGFVAASLHRLFRAAEVGYFETVAAYVMASVAALISHVPGGLGVLEFVIAMLIGGGQAVGALIAFRVVYFFVPLLIGATVLGITEILRAQGRLATR